MTALDLDAIKARADKLHRAHIMGASREDSVSTYSEARDDIRALVAEVERQAALLATVIDLLNHMPVMSGASSPEPFVKFRLIDFTKAVEVAQGTTHPDEWIHVPCKNLTGTDPAQPGYVFSHSSHWWNEFEQIGHVAKRTPHWCNGVRESSGKGPTE